MRPIFIVLVLLSVGVTSAMDVAGAWTLSYRNEEGQTRKSTLTLKAEGSTITGNIASSRGTAQISDGTITDNAISFVVVRKGNGDEVRIRFKGNIEGDIMKLLMQLRDRTPIPVTATRSPQSHGGN